jgi:arsenate reductase
MTKELTIWHNTRCSKSRATLALLQERGHEPNIVSYLDETPNANEIKRVLGLLDIEPRGLMRTKESLYGELGLADEDNDEALIRAMVENPKLIERPVVICGNRAAIGRPPENVLPVLE